ncbi:hypothetical protein ACLOJK_035803 [Asimina triloba]
MGGLHDTFFDETNGSDCFKNKVPPVRRRCDASVLECSTALPVISRHCACMYKCEKQRTVGFVVGKESEKERSRPVSFALFRTRASRELLEFLQLKCNPKHCNSQTGLTIQ